SARFGSGEADSFRWVRRALLVVTLAAFLLAAIVPPIAAPTSTKVCGFQRGQVTYVITGPPVTAAECAKFERLTGGRPNPHPFQWPLWTCRWQAVHADVTVGVIAGDPRDANAPCVSLKAKLHKLGAFSQIEWRGKVNLD